MIADIKRDGEQQGFDVEILVTPIEAPDCIVAYLWPKTLRPFREPIEENTVKDKPSKAKVGLASIGLPGNQVHIGLVDGDYNADTKRRLNELIDIQEAKHAKKH